MLANLSPMTELPDENRFPGAKAGETPVMWLVDGTLTNLPTGKGYDPARWQEYAAQLRDRKVAREFKVFRLMVEMYCRSHHKGDVPCPACQAVLAEMACRLRDCPSGADKQACEDCKNQCRGPSVQFQTREIMRWAAPRMAVRHPIEAIRHAWHAMRNSAAARKGGKRAARDGGSCGK